MKARIRFEGGPADGRAGEHEFPEKGAAPRMHVPAFVAGGIRSFEYALARLEIDGGELKLAVYRYVGPLAPPKPAIPDDPPNAPTAVDVLERAADLVVAGRIANSEDCRAHCPFCAIGIAKSELDDERGTTMPATRGFFSGTPQPGDGALMRARESLLPWPDGVTELAPEESVAVLRAAASRLRQAVAGRA